MKVRPSAWVFQKQLPNLLVTNRVSNNRPIHILPRAPYRHSTSNWSYFCPCPQDRSAFSTKISSRTNCLAERVQVHQLIRAFSEASRIQENCVNCGCWLCAQNNRHNYYVTQLCERKKQPNLFFIALDYQATR